MDSRDRYIESNGLTFIVPFDDPIEGTQFDPTRTKSRAHGTIEIPGWFPENDELTVFRFGRIEVPSLAAALNAVNRILRRYEPQFKGTPVQELVTRAMELYLNCERPVELPKSHNDIKTLLAIARWVADARVTDCMIAAGRRGRFFDPQPMARQLFSAVAELDYKNMPSIRRMIVEMAAQKAALVLGRQENHTILDTLVAALGKLMACTLFVCPYQAAGLWYNRAVSDLEQAMAPVKRLWGAPYVQLSLEIRNELGCVIYSLRGHSQDEAKLRMMALVADLARCGPSLKTFRGSVIALAESRPWQCRKFAAASRRLDNLFVELGRLPVLLDSFTRLLRHELMQISGLLVGGEWASASRRLNRLADQCMW